MERHGLSSQFCGGFSFHGCARTGVFYNSKNECASVLYVLACGDVVHDRFKFIHRGGPSSCERVDSRDGTKKPNE
jgi:hypothetical protein